MDFPFIVGTVLIFAAIVGTGGMCFYWGFSARKDVQDDLRADLIREDIAFDRTRRDIRDIGVQTFIDMTKRVEEHDRS